MSAKRHFRLAGQQTDVADLYRMEKIEKHVAKCFEARKNGDWDTVVMESDAAVVAGADSASQVGHLLLLLSPFCMPSWMSYHHRTCVKCDDETIEISVLTEILSPLVVNNDIITDCDYSKSPLC